MNLHRRLCLKRLLPLAGSALAAGGLAAGCASPSPPVRLYALRDLPPSGEPLPARRPGLGPWELSMRVDMPGLLERDTLHRLSGAAGLELLAGHRWAEPLRDAVPRILLRDLQALTAADRVWPAPAPREVRPLERLHVTLLALHAGPDPERLRVAARWWWVRLAPTAARGNGSALPGAQGAVPEGKGAHTATAPGAEADFALALPDASADALAEGHRLALWRLARRVVDSAA